MTDLSEAEAKQLQDGISVLNSILSRAAPSVQGAAPSVQGAAPSVQGGSSGVSFPLSVNFDRGMFAQKDNAHTTLHYSYCQTVTSPTGKATY